MIFSLVCSIMIAIYASSPATLANCGACLSRGNSVCIGMFKSSPSSCCASGETGDSCMPDGDTYCAKGTS